MRSGPLLFEPRDLETRLGGRAIFARALRGDFSDAAAHAIAGAHRLCQHGRNGGINLRDCAGRETREPAFDTPELAFAVGVRCRDAFTSANDRSAVLRVHADGTDYPPQEPYGKQHHGQPLVLPAPQAANEDETGHFPKIGCNVGPAKELRLLWRLAETEAEEIVGAHRHRDHAGRRADQDDDDGPAQR